MPSNDTLKYLVDHCTPAFESVSDEVNLHELKAVKRNSFYKEYQEALKLSKIILKRFGYHISEIQHSTVEKILVPPFWIDMSKLFELYVLGLLKDKYGDKILFQAKGKYGRLDYLLTDEIQPLIIDAKYRPTYQQDGLLSYIIDDIRQMSGYARDVGVLDKLPDNLTDGRSIEGLTKFYKVPIAVPILKK